MFKRRHFLAATLAAGAALALAAGPAASQAWPTRSLTLVVPQPAGASSDTLARLIANHLKDQLGQAVVVENRVGGGGIIGAESVAKAPADGYTLYLYGPATITIPLYLKANYDPVKDFVPLGRIAEAPFLFIVHPSVPANTMKEFVEYAKKNPGKLNYGTVMNSGMQLDQLRFNKVAGVDMVEVPFNGAAPITQAMLSDQIQVTLGGAGSLPHIREGKLKAIAVTAQDRYRLVPDLATAREGGVAFDSGFWFGIATVANTPKPVVERLNRELRAAMKKDDVRAAVEKIAMTPLDPSPEEMEKVIRAEWDNFSAAAKSINLQPK
jgi:tripartite-type tricarboxylate transporter receptor subunit TctC